MAAFGAGFRFLGKISTGLLNGYGERPSRAFGWLTSFLAVLTGLLAWAGLEILDPKHSASFGNPFFYLLQKVTLQRPIWAEPWALGASWRPGSASCSSPARRPSFSWPCATAWAAGGDILNVGGLVHHLPTVNRLGRFREVILRGREHAQRKNSPAGHSTGVLLRLGETKMRLGVRYLFFALA